MIDFKPITFKDKKKEKVQREAYDAWASNNYKGIIENATGTGKSRIATMAVQQHIDKNIVIVVPKIDIMEQIYDELLTQLNIKAGRIGGGHSTIDDRTAKIKICIINSIRETKFDADLLIMDECHRIPSPHNIRFLQNGQFKKILGLTATAVRQDGAHTTLFKYAPIVFKFPQSIAIEEGLLAGFDLVYIKTPLNYEERSLYNEVDSKARQLFSEHFSNDFNALQNATKNGYGVTRALARELMTLFSRRKSIVHNTEKKVKCVGEIIKYESQDDPHTLPKTIVFCEFKKTLVLIVKDLKEWGIDAVQYHSGMRDKRKKEMLEKFKSGECRVMVAVKSLDEGTDVPDAELAIITSGTSVKRQAIQRVGRVLRTYGEGKTAKVYVAYTNETKDEDWTSKATAELKNNAQNVSWI